MSESATKTSNDGSRKKVEVKYLSDEEVQKDIKNWGNIYIAAINPEWINSKIANNDNNSRKKYTLNVKQQLDKTLNGLSKEENLATLGAKAIKTEKAKKAREAAKKAKKRREKEVIKSSKVNSGEKGIR